MPVYITALYNYTLHHSSWIIYIIKLKYCCANTSHHYAQSVHILYYAVSMETHPDILYHFWLINNVNQLFFNSEYFNFPQVTRYEDSTVNALFYSTATTSVQKAYQWMYIEQIFGIEKPCMWKRELELMVGWWMQYIRL